MRYQVFGTRVIHVSVEVDAEDAEEAFERAMEAGRGEIEEWDVDTNWYGVEPI